MSVIGNLQGKSVIEEGRLSSVVAAMNGAVPVGTPDQDKCATDATT